MRVENNSGIKLTYPDDVAMAFNPFLCIVEGDGLSRVEVRLKEEGGGDAWPVSCLAYKGKALFDLREYMQALFDGTAWGDIDYSLQSSDAGTAKAVNVDIEAYKGADETMSCRFTFECMVIWGGLMPGERFSAGERVVTWFRNYPFSVGIFTGGGKNVIYGFGNSKSNIMTIGKRGIYNITLDRGSDDKEWLSVWNGDVNINESVFDKTFDRTFSYVIQGESERKVLVRLECPCYDEGVYLRWIDRHGFYCYYLFKKGIEQRKVEGDGEFYRNNMYNYNELYGFSRAGGRRLRYSRGDTFQVAAPLVDGATFDFLQDVTTSPVVDLYMGDGGDGKPKWLPVVVEPGTYSKSGQALQDFLLNVALPSVPLQSL